MRFLLDTDICIGILRGRTSLLECLQSQRPDDCGISTVSIFELLSGVERCRRPDEERSKVEKFLEPLHLLPFDHESARRTASIRWHLEKAGTPIGPYDLQLAGQALALDVTLVTGNIREFSRVPDLKFESWME